jgi:hypothetical protein
MTQTEPGLILANADKAAADLEVHLPIMFFRKDPKAL